MNCTFVLLTLLCSLYCVALAASSVQKREKDEIESKPQSCSMIFNSNILDINYTFIHINSISKKFSMLFHEIIQYARISFHFLLKPKLNNFKYYTNDLTI